MASLREEILKLTNPEPASKDPENYFEEDSLPKLVDKEELGGIDVSHDGSKLRRKAAGLLSDSDNKYAGKKLSRKDWMADSDSDMKDDDDDDDMAASNDDDDIDDDIDDENEIRDDYYVNSDDNDDIKSGDEDDASLSAESGEDNSDQDDDLEGFKSKIKSSVDKSGFTFTDDGDYGKYADDDYENDDDLESDDNDGGDIKDIDNDDEDDNDDDDDDGLEESGSESEEDEDGIQKFSAAAKDEIEKGNAASQQLNLWDTLIEGRIKLQKAVSLINQLPQHSEWTEFKQGTSSFESEAQKTQKVLKHLLDSLVHLQSILLAQNTDTAGLMDKSKKTERKTQSKSQEDEDDEEIPSDTDEEMGTMETSKQPIKVEKRKIKMEEYPGLLKKRFDSMHEYRDSTIQKWYDKTRLAGGRVKGKSFSAFDQSALVQIKQILADKDRLVRRTQMKRSVYRVLGKEPKREDPEILPSETGELEEVQTSKPNEEDKYDEEIFDDDDFYHQILRELIQKKTADINDPVASTRQWLQIQKLRNKKKRNTDPRMSKDRKLKYSVHKKLVNFMTPIDDCEWSHEARDDLFKSLFGKRFMNTVSG